MAKAEFPPNATHTTYAMNAEKYATDAADTTAKTQGQNRSLR